MRHMINRVVGLGLAAAVSGCVMVPVGPPGHGTHRGAVVMAPAPIVISARPHMVFMTEFGVSFAPELEFDVYEVGGVWYSFRSSTWYRADAYDGPWGVVEHRYVPQKLVKVKPGHVRKFYFEHEGKKKHDRGERGRGKDRHKD